MKTYLAFIFLFICTLYYAQFSNWERLSQQTLNGHEISLSRSFDFNNFRVNPDGTKFYKTKVRLSTKQNGKLVNLEIPDYFYASNSTVGFSTPCALIDPTNKTLCIYILEKDANQQSYTMQGFAYFYSLVNKSLHKEKIFENANIGWYAFFGGSANGNPELYHFAFAGYYAMKSIRVNGKWETYYLGEMSPEVAQNQYSSHKNILIANNLGIDTFIGVTNAYNRPQVYSSGYGNSLNFSSSQISGMAIGAGILFGVGKLIWNGLTSSSSSSENSSYSNKQSIKSKEFHYGSENLKTKRKEFETNYDIKYYIEYNDGAWGYLWYSKSKSKYYWGDFASDYYSNLNDALDNHYATIAMYH